MGCTRQQHPRGALVCPPHLDLERRSREPGTRPSRIVLSRRRRGVPAFDKDNLKIALSHDVSALSSPDAK